MTLKFRLDIPRIERRGDNALITISPRQLLGEQDIPELALTIESLGTEFLPLRRVAKCVILNRATLY